MSSSNSTAVRITLAICATVIIIVGLCACSTVAIVFLGNLSGGY